VSVTPYIGLNWSKLINSNSNSGLNYVANPTISMPSLSIEARKKIHNKGEIGLSLGYKPISFIQLKEPEIIDFISKIRYNLKYLDVSANYNYSIFKELYLSGGLVFRYLLKESRKWIIAGNYTDAPDANTYPSRDLGITLGVGYNYRRLDARFNYYIGLSALDRGGKARIIQFDIGYRIIN
jgi:hypothetical protein